MKLIILEIKGCFDCPLFNRDDNFCFKMSRCISVMFDIAGDDYPNWCPLPDVEKGLV
jgi:hypothetical protein